MSAPLHKLGVRPGMTWRTIGCPPALVPVFAGASAAPAEADFLAVTQVAIDDDWSALRFRPRGEIARLTRASERVE